MTPEYCVYRIEKSRGERSDERKRVETVVTKDRDPGGRQPQTAGVNRIRCWDRMPFYE